MDSETILGCSVVRFSGPAESHTKFHMKLRQMGTVYFSIRPTVFWPAVRHGGTPETWKVSVSSPPILNFTHKDFL